MDTLGFNPRVAGTPARFGIGYFGAQGTHAMKLLNYVDGASRYVDLTAGGMGTPYRMCREKHLPVAINDIGFYSHICGKATFQKQELHDYAWWVNYLHDMKSFAKEGIISEMLAWKWLNAGNVPSELPKETIRYLDGLLANSQDNAILLAAVGKMLLSDFTFRGLGFSKTTPAKQPLADINVDACIEYILKNVGFYTLKNMEIPEDLKEQNVVSWNDASNFVNSFDFEGAVVYMDPAWPWNQPSVTNPYFLSSTVLPCMLRQSYAPDSLIVLTPWECGDEERIMNDVIHWVKTPLSKGAKRVIVNTQSTNYPDPIKVVEPILKEHFVFEQYIDWNANSGLALTQNFKEFAWIFTGVK